MSRSARLPLPLALAAGLCLGLSGTAALAGTTSLSQAGGAAATTSANPSSTTPSLGEALGPSNPDQIALAEHLRAKGVIFYGAYWCTHCFRQKLLFGQQAGNRLPYVECAKDETGARTCEAAKVLAYPTWVMGNDRREGVMTLKELATWTGYQGSTNFPTSLTGS